MIADCCAAVVFVLIWILDVELPGREHSEMPRAAKVAVGDIFEIFTDDHIL
jgi:hypothetical protein